MNFEVIIPVKLEHSTNLFLLIQQIKKHIKPSKISIIGDVGLKYKIPNDANFINEDNLLPNLNKKILMDKIASLNNRAKSRATWYFQQFLKMGYARFLNGGGL